MSHTFRQVDRETLFLLPPSLDDWLPEGHLSGILRISLAVNFEGL